VLAEAVGGDTKTADVLARYRRDRAWQLLTAEPGGRCVGVAGYTVDDSEVTLLHIAVVPTDRRTGYGRALISAILARNQHCQRVVAETDADAVGFYRALGFVVTLLGEKYAGTERFRVCLNVDVHETGTSGQGPRRRQLPGRGETRSTGGRSNRNSLSRAEFSSDRLAIFDRDGDQRQL
jgi:GNAT superfamily N-acetyltransferase